MAEDAAKDFLKKYKLGSLTESLENGGATNLEHFRYLRNNLVELKAILPILDDRARFVAAIDAEDSSTSQPVRKISTSNAPVIIRANLEAICEKYEDGKTFWKQKDIKFEKTEREMLAPIITRYFFEISGGSVNKHMFNEMFEIIRQQFPSEHNKNIWYVGGSHPKGLLYDCYRSLRGKEKELKGAKLRLSTIPYNETTQIFEAWDECYHVRRFEIMSEEFRLDEYSVLNNFSKAHDLITKDFLRINGKSSDIPSKVPVFINRFYKIFNEYRKLVKDDTELCDEIIKIFSTDPPVNDHSIFLAFYTLPLLLRENFVHRDGKRMRPSLFMSRNAFITIIPTEAKLTETIETKRSNALERGTTVQPYIVAVGSVKSTTKYFVVFDNLLLPRAKVIEALDVHFKLHDVFNLLYAAECQSVLFFIQKFFYGLEYKDDSIRPPVEALISDILKT